MIMKQMNLKILYAEDSDFDMELIVELLHKDNIQADIMRVESEAELIKELDKGGYDIIFSDYKMPNLDGLTVLKLAKQKQPDVPCILISGTLGEYEAIEALKHGADDYILKQRPARLTTSVRKVIEEYKEKSFLKLARTSLIESEHRFKTLFERTNETIFLIDDERKIVDSNPAGCNLLSASLPEILGHTIDEYVIPEHYHKVQEYWEMFKKGELQLGDIQIHTVTGKIKNVEFTATADLFPKLHVLTVRDITEHKLTKNQLIEALRRSEALLKEVYHRVKNNLQVIISLLKLQASTIKDPAVKEYLLVAQNRVRAMSLMHELLYRSKDLTKINFKEYISKIINQLIITYSTSSPNIEIEIESDDIFLDIENSIPLGLLINEVVSNSLKYAFHDTQNPKIGISFKSLDKKKHSLIISDNGCGLPEGTDLLTSDSLGFQLISSLATQIDGKIELESNGGTTYKLIFDEVKYKPRI